MGSESDSYNQMVSAVMDDLEVEQLIKQISVAARVRSVFTRNRLTAAPLDEQQNTMLGTCLIPKQVPHRLFLAVHRHRGRLKRGSAGLSPKGETQRSRIPAPRGRRVAPTMNDRSAPVKAIMNRFADLDRLPAFACYTYFLTLPGSEIPDEMKDSLFEPFAPSG